MDNSPSNPLKALQEKFPWLSKQFSEKKLLWILAVFLILAGTFSNISSGSAIVIGLGIILIILAIIDPKTIKKFTSKYLSFERHEYSEEERQIAVQAGQDEISPEIKHELNQITEEAKSRKDEERAPEDYLVLAIEAWEEKKYENGLRMAYAGLQLDPKNPRTRAGLYNILGIIYKDLKSYFLAEENYRKAIQADNKFLFAHYNFGILYSDQKKHAKAEGAYHKVLDLNPNFAFAYSGLGNLYLDQKKYPEAYEAYQKALEIDPDNVLINFNLGVYFEDQKKYPEAEVVYKKTIEFDPNFAPAHNNLGSMYIDLNCLQEAETSINRALELDSTNPVYHVSLGELYMNQGKLDDAEAAFNKALELDPDYKEAKENLEEVRKLRDEDKDSPAHPTLDLGETKSKESPR